MMKASRSTAVSQWIIAACVCGVLAAPAVGQMVTIDNEDPEFTILYGEWTTGTYGQPYGTYYNWAMTTATGEPAAAVEWRPNLPQAGGYLVSVWYVQGGNRADNATFRVHHAGGTAPVVVNQQVYGETWYELGTFPFNAGTGGYVTLDNDAHLSVVIADAVRFTPETTTVELTVDATPVGWGSTDPAVGGPYTQFLNEVVPISAMAYTGYEFDHWTVSAGSPVAGPTSPSTTVTMDQSKTVTAVFVEEGVVQPEFRGFWADAFHEGFRTEAQIDAMIARALAGNYNAIVPEVLAYQDYSDDFGGHGAYWDSDIVPMAHDIEEDLDPLEYLVEQCHANGLEVHPWLVSFRVSTIWPPAGNPTLAAHPEWLMVPRAAIGGGQAPVSGKYTLDPGSPDVQEYLMSIVRELVTNYEIDGIHWDYIRYTTADAGYPAYTWYDKSGLARFQAITGYSGTPATDYGPWNDFRRREITEFVRRAQTEVATLDNPRQPLRHTAALVTWYPASTDFHQTRPYYESFSDWEYWQSMGYLDATIPMCYFDENSYPATYREWVDNSVTWATNYNRHTFIGPGIYMNTFADSKTQIIYARDAKAHGFCTYSYMSTNDGGEPWSDWYGFAADNFFTEPAPPPTMPWRYPLTATKGAVYGRLTDGATGEPIDDATITINGFAMVQTDGNGFFVVTKLAAPVGGEPIALGAEYPGYADVVRPAVWLERAGYTEANLALGAWLSGDYDVDGDVDLDDLERFAPSLTGPDNGPPPAGGDLFDFDVDDDVDLADVSVFQAAFGD